MEAKKSDYANLKAYNTLYIKRWTDAYVGDKTGMLTPKSIYGKIAAITEQGIYLDITGNGIAGLLPKSEIQEESPLSPGNNILVTVIGYTNTGENIEKKIKEDVSEMDSYNTMTSIYLSDPRYESNETLFYCTQKATANQASSARVRNLRKQTGLTQPKFGEAYAIPMRTIKNWELGINECPPYVINLLERAVTEDLAAGRFQHIDE